MLHYDFPLYRPPSEGNNLIIQATLGCSTNRCTFCSMYRTKSYQARPLDAVLGDIQQSAALAPHTRRVFLADGDALSRDTEDLLVILEALATAFPQLTRVSSYALPANLIKKTPKQLRQLREAGLSLLYYGVESGDAELLRIIRKGATPDMMAEGLHKAVEAGMKVSATVILGLAGRARWQAHIEATAALVNRTALTYLSTLQLGLEPEREAEFIQRFNGDFEWQDDLGMLREQQLLVRLVAPEKPVIFRSNHASNALPLAGNLPRDADRLLAELGAAEAGERDLIPQWMRGY